MPWPDAPDAAATQVTAVPTNRAAGRTGRSEDWTLGDLTVEVEASYVELDSLAPSESERFRREFTEEHLVSPVTAALAIAHRVPAANARTRAIVARSPSSCRACCAVRSRWAHGPMPARR